MQYHLQSGFEERKLNFPPQIGIFHAGVPYDSSLDKIMLRWKSRALIIQVVDSSKG
jgi:hypothetical protein